MTSSRSLRGIGEFHLAADDSYKSSRKELGFQGTVEGGKIEGLDFFVKSPSQLTFWLKIDNQKNIEEKIVFLPQETHPKGMPFSLKE